MKDTVLVGLVEDQALFREGMKAILCASGTIDVVFEVSNGFSMLDRLRVAKILPHVMLVDLSLPADEGREFSGIQVTDALRTHFPDMKVIILSVHQDENFIVELIERGAHGYLVKDSDPEEVVEAIHAVHQRGSYINERTLKAIQGKMRKKPRAKEVGFNVTLTRREEEILKLICEQLTTEEIANRLFISVKTVNGHRNNLLQKTASRNVAGLVVYAVKHKYVNVL